jgi:hypothetical protein
MNRPAHDDNAVGSAEPGGRRAGQLKFGFQHLRPCNLQQKLADLERTVRFCYGVPGFELTQWQAALNLDEKFRGMWLGETERYWPSELFAERRKTPVGDQTYIPGPTANTVRAADGKVLTSPEGWVLLPPGDAALTRRVKAAGDHWVVAERKGRKVFSRGVWAAEATIDRVRADLAAERSTAGFAKKKEADARRREKAQVEYVEDFFGAVVAFLNFHPAHIALAERLARAVTAHATPVGSGTVARTKQIPVEQRAEAAVIAWMRHQTTGYDSLVIPRVKGKRREVRRVLARRSNELLARYRRGEPVGDGCPLWAALVVRPDAPEGLARP